jgi:hypothetical protein
MKTVKPDAFKMQVCVGLGAFASLSAREVLATPGLNCGELVNVSSSLPDGLAMCMCSAYWPSLQHLYRSRAALRND